MKKLFHCSSIWFLKWDKYIVYQYKQKEIQWKSFNTNVQVRSGGRLICQGVEKI